MTQPDYSDAPISYTTPPAGFGKKEETYRSLVKELSPNDFLQDMMEQLRGRVWDKNEQEYVQVEGAEPLMNDEGRDTFFHYATSGIAQIVTMSNYTKNERLIHSLVLAIIKDASIHFHIHHERYDLDKSKVRMITTKLMTLTLSAFYKAIGGGDRKAATSNISETIQTLMRPPGEIEKQKEKSLFAKMLGR